jgi:hypothetical protein
MLENFNFYFDLAFNSGDQNLFSDFLNNKELLESGFEYLSEYDYYLKDEMIVDTDEPVFDMTIITREDFLKNKFQLNKKLLLEEIKNKLTNLVSEEREALLKTFFNDLYKVSVKVNKSVFEFQELIEQEISALTNDLKLLYKDEVNSHKLFAKLNSISDTNYGTYFGLKSNIKPSFISDLYDICIDLFLINDEEVFEEDFNFVFTSSNLNGEVQIRFVEKNFPIVYFLESIQPFFEDFSFLKMEQSNVFLNKQSKLLTATDLSTTKARNKNTSLPILKKIDLAVLELKAKHLK